MKIFEFEPMWKLNISTYLQDGAKTIFPSTTGAAQILVVVAQIHTNGALKFGKRKIWKM